MDAQKSAVIRFYDTHPINEDEILAKLGARGDDLATLSEDQLKDFDQDHYGGIEVVDALVQGAGIRREHRVLDVCSGMGGPARWIAYKVGCHVTGLDFTLSRVEAARRLSERVRLDVWSISCMATPPRCRCRALYSMWSSARRPGCMCRTSRR